MLLIRLVPMSSGTWWRAIFQNRSISTETHLPPSVSALTVLGRTSIRAGTLVRARTPCASSFSAWTASSRSGWASRCPRAGRDCRLRRPRSSPGPRRPTRSTCSSRWTGRRPISSTRTSAASPRAICFPWCSSRSYLRSGRDGEGEHVKR